jgi:diguanylate cyclase (GGDEF)-like protein
MQDYDDLLQRVRENEEILRKFHLLESKILSVLNLKAFFENLLNEMMRIFHIPFVWVTVLEGSRLADMINCIPQSRILEQRINYVGAESFQDCFPNGSLPVLANTELSRYKSFFPDGRIIPIRSIALAPVHIDGETVGSLNQGDITPTRFEAEMDTSLLEQLMVKISLCLSNVLAHEQLRFYAYHDPLTGLLNRRAFETEFIREWSRAKRHGSTLSLIFADLDNFKQINDRYGHDTGDKALQHVANTFEIVSRKEDIVSRFAGDEFVLLLPESGSGEAGALMERVEHHLEATPLMAGDNQLIVSLSYGIASGKGGAENDPDELLRQADKALYLVKRERKRQKTK